MAKPDEWVDIDEYLHIVRTHVLAAATYLCKEPGMSLATTTADRQAPYSDRDRSAGTHAGGGERVASAST